jgi:ketosteroid isomerase-like protein
VSERENLQALQRAYKSFAEGNISVLLNLLTDDVDWNFPPSSAEIPWAQHAWRGRDGVAQGFKKMAELVEIQVFAPDEFIVAQDSVVVLGHERSKMRKTGRCFEGNWAAVFTFRDGLICRYREYHHTSALDAAYRGTDS